MMKGKWKKGLGWGLVYLVALAIGWSVGAQLGKGMENELWSSKGDKEVGHS